MTTINNKNNNKHYYKKINKKIQNLLSDHLTQEDHLRPIKIKIIHFQIKI